MTTRIISLHDVDDEDPLPPPVPLPVLGEVGTGATPATSVPVGGVLVVGDTSVAVITHTTVVGRDPAGDPQVIAGSMPGVVLTGADLSVSRVHAVIRVEGDRVSVVDRGSTNGTHLRRAGTRAVQRLDPHAPVEITHGDTITFGGVACRWEPLDDPTST